MARKSQPHRPRELVSMREAAARYHISHDTVRRLLRQGELTGYKLGHQVLRVDLDELDALFKPIKTTKGRVG